MLAGFLEINMKKKTGKKILWITAIAVIILASHLLGIFRPVENIVTLTLNPVMRSLYSISSEIKGKYETKEDKAWLNQRVQELEGKVNNLAADNARLRIVEEENKILRQSLDFLSENEYEYVVGSVISRGEITGDSKQTEKIIIDKGRADGLQKGLVVVTEHGVVAGKIIEAKERTSYVYLVNNKDCRLAATVMGEEKTSGIVQGELGLTMKMEFIPQTQIIEEGDTVVTSGLEAEIPRGLVIGRVTKVVRESNDLWKTATIEPLLDTENLIIVSVLKTE